MTVKKSCIVWRKPSQLLLKRHSWFKPRIIRQNRKEIFYKLIESQQLFQNKTLKHTNFGATRITCHNTSQIRFNKLRQQSVVLKLSGVQLQNLNLLKSQRISFCILRAGLPLLRHCIACSHKYMKHAVFILFF